MAAGHTVALVSGTNGKTTTTRLLAAALSTRGPVSTNTAGANLMPGLVSALSYERPGAAWPWRSTRAAGRGWPRPRPTWSCCST